MIGLPALPNAAWTAAQTPGWLAFRRALHDPERAQRRLLVRTLARNADTEVGRRHGFGGIRSFDEYRARVPLGGHAELEPALERIARGETAVLTSAPVKSFAWTSGSTASAKRVPCTAELLREFRRAIGPWIVDLFRSRPRLAGGPAYWSVTPLASRDELVGDGAVRVEFEEDTEYLGGWMKRLVDATLAVPGSIRHERDVDRFRYLTLLFLLRTPELRLISVWHPSFLTLLLDELERSFEALVRDVHDGLRDARWPRLARPQRARALALEAAGPRDTRALWPRLGLISTWTDGHAQLGARELRRSFPGVELQPKGLLATEACVSLPCAGAHPLAIRSHVFEFERDDGSLCAAHELLDGEEASVIVTTGGGLYRYRLGDRVRVDGRVARTPSVRFVGRSDARSDLRGEKLSEGFVAASIDELLRATRTAARFAVLRPEVRRDGPPRYCLQLEAERVNVGPLQERMERLLRRNPHYDWCIRLGQLEPCRVVPVVNGFERFVEERRARGQRVGDIKPPALLAAQAEPAACDEFR